MSNPLSCLKTQKNIGTSSCKKLPQLLKGMITTSADFSIAEDDVNTLANWQDGIFATYKRNRIFYWPVAVNLENLNEESVYEETPLSTMNVRDGRYRFRASFQENLELHKSMFTHKNFQGRIFLIDIENKVVGTRREDGSFAGFTLDLLNPEKMTFNDGSIVSKSMVYISLQDNLELDKFGRQIEGGFLRGLQRLTDASLTIVGTPSSTEIVVKVTNALDNEPVLGLNDGDFVLTDGAGTAQTISSVVESTLVEGQYTLSGTALVSGILDLASPDTISVKGFEGIALEITI